MESQEVLEFNVLGKRVKFSPDGDQSVDARNAVELINKEEAEIRRKQPELDDKNVAILVALKLASDKIQLEQDFVTDIERLESSVVEALSFVSDENKLASLDN